MKKGAQGQPNSFMIAGHKKPINNQNYMKKKKKNHLDNPTVYRHADTHTHTHKDSTEFLPGSIGFELHRKIFFNKMSRTPPPKTVSRREANS